MNRHTLWRLTGLALALCPGCGLLDLEDIPTPEPVGEADVRTARFGEAELHYEVIAGEAIMQGDIMLGPVEALEARADEARTVDDGDFGSSTRGLLGLRASTSFWVGDRWPGGQIPYVVDQDSYTPTERAAVVATLATVIQTLQNATPLQLVPRQDERDYVRIQDYGPGENPGNAACGSSPIGMQGGEQPLRLIPAASASCLLHEFLHAFGVPHEQARSDRQSYVEIIWENITDGHRHNFEAYGFDDFEAFGPYDYASIMHYGAGAFNGGKTCTNADNSGCTIRPKDPQIPVSRLNSSVLTELDRRGLCTMYGSDGGQLSVSLREFEGMTDGVPRYRVNRPVVRVSFTRGGVRPDFELMVTSDRDGGLLRVIGQAQSPTRPVDLTLPPLSPGRHTLTFTSLTGCPQDVVLPIDVEAGGVVLISAPSVEEAASFDVRLQTGVAQAPDSEGLWFLRRVSQTTEATLGTASLFEGVSFSGLCNGEYEIGVRPLSGPLSAEQITPARLTVRDRPEDPPMGCRPTIEILEPADGSGVVVDTQFELRAAFSDDQPERDDPIYPVVWVDVDTSAELARGPTASAILDRAGPATIEARYGSARAQVTIEVLAQGEPPRISLTRPPADFEYLLDVDVIIMGSGYYLVEQARALVFHPQDTIPDANVEWSLHCPDAPLTGGGVIGTGRNLDMQVRVVHAGMTRCELSVRATGLDGLVSSARVPVFIQGPAN